MIDRAMDSRKPDHFEWRFLAVIVAILALGVLSIYSATYSQPTTGLPLYAKQIVWILAGAGAAAIARLVRAGRTTGFLIEALVSVIAGVAAGLAATALDFGGWREPDWRAGTFCLLVAIAAIGLFRLVRMTLARGSNR